MGYCHGVTPGELRTLAARAGTLLAERGWSLAMAESCTGGLIAHLITEIPGSSSYLIGGIIAYANRIKRDVLGVPEKELVAHGAVSHEVALAMAQGVRHTLGTDVGLSTTGVAGPSGGTAAKPVGTVYVAISSPLGDGVEHHLWPTDRQGNKRLSARAALELLCRHVHGDCVSHPVG